MLNALTILSWFAFLAVGCVLGWLIRSHRSRAEKAAINDGWRGQLDAQNTERKRIEHQNRSLMRQVSELQLKLTGRGVGETPASDGQSDDTKTDRQAAPEPPASSTDSPARPADESAAEKDELARRRIAKLQSELTKWQERLPPLIERFRQRDADAQRLEKELSEAQALLTRFQQQPSFDETRAGAYPPGDPDAVSDASNDRLALAPPKALRSVKGIGPATSRRLANLGLHELADLANATDEDLLRIDEKIKGARGKTVGWRRQARALLDKHKSQ